MKRMFIFLVVLLILPFSVKAAMGYDSYSDLMTRVRVQTSITSGNNISSAELFQIIRRSIIWVSSDIQGREGIILLTTTAEQPFYHVADTNILSVHNITYITDGETKSIKAIPPQYIEQIYDLTTLDEADDAENTPVAYDYFADSLQLMPIPIRTGDTVLIKCFMAYEIQTEADLDSAKTLPADMKSTLIEPIIAFACILASAQIKEYEQAQFYMGLYNLFKTSILQQQREPMDQPKNEPVN